MKIGIISDTHGDAKAWTLALKNHFKYANLILHAGDVLYHGPRNPLVAAYNPAALADELNQSPVPVMIARGNCDAEVDQSVLDVPVESPYLLIHDGQRRILLHHGHRWSEEETHRLAVKYAVQVVVSGHTHLPRLEKAGGVVWLNPGSCSLPKPGNPPSVAILDGEQARIIELENGRLLWEIRL
ncbi:MAG: phosphodiesterase [Bacillota bacterium]